MIRRVIDQAEETILSFMLIVMILLVFVEVILRHVFNEGLLWAEEATLYLSAWFVLFGASYGIKTGAHIAVEAFVEKLPAGLRKIVALLTIVLAQIYCGLFLYGSWIYLSKMKKIGIEMEDLPIPKWIAMSILIIGFVLLSVRIFELACRVIKGTQPGFHFVDEAEEALHHLQEEQQEGKA